MFGSISKPNAFNIHTAHLNVNRTRNKINGDANRKKKTKQ